MKCPSCFQDNPESQKFCGECGVRLSPVAVSEPLPLPASYTPPHLAQKILTSRSALEGERKLVTVLFCDIANSTQLAARVGADAMHVLLNRFFELALGEVHRFEGTINQFLGDGFMALFGAPLAHEDHARRALLAALGIQQRLRDASAQEGTLRDVRVRMGVNTGTVVVGKIGDNLRMDYTAVGDSTNLAARLQQQAQPGAIYVSEATQRAAAFYFEFRLLGKQALKGIAESVEIYELLKARSAGEGSFHSEAGRISSPLVGRERELSVLTTSLKTLRQGCGGIVLLQGEPGVGKSRLVAEAKRCGGSEGMLWLEGRSISFGRTLSYWPFIEILKQGFGIDDNDAEAQTWRKLEQGCEDLFGTRADEIVPYLATVLALEMTVEHEQRVKYLDPQALGRQVFLSMRQLFERLAQRQPVLLLLEDWHWVDQSSVALCEHLLSLAGSIGLLFWFVARAEPGEPTARIRAAAGAEPAFPVQQITLTPLAEEQSNVLLDHLVGTDHLPTSLRNQILRKTEGNPFFLEEVIRALIADGALVQDDRGRGWRLTKPVEALALPDTVQGVIVARIDRLEEGVKSVLKLASVIGRSFFLRILRAVSEAGNRLDSGLAQLEQAELIRLRQQLPELEYIFKHALVQEAAYGSIVAERRRLIHRSVAEAIEKQFADRLDEFTSMLAYHYARAEDWDKAQAYLFKAGDQSGRMAADAEALEHYRHAESAYMKVAAKDLTPLERASLDRKLGQAFSGVGDYDQAVEHLSRALSHLGLRYPRTPWGIRRSTMTFLAAHFLRRLRLRFDRATRPDMDLAVGQEISAICRSLAWLDFFTDEERMGLDSLIELYAGERSGDALCRVRGLAMLGMVLLMFQAMGLARKYLTEAVAIAQETIHPAAIGEAFLVLGTLDWMVGSLDESERSFERSATAYRSAGDLRGWGAAAVYLLIVLWQRGHFASASNLAVDLHRTGQDAGDPHVTTWALNGLGWIAFTTGSLDQAALHLSKSIDISIRVSSHRGKAVVAGFLGKCRLRQGRLSEASANIQEAILLIKTNNFRGWQCADPHNTFAELCLINVERMSGAPRRSALRKARRACAQALRTARGAVTWMPEALRLLGTFAWLSGDTKSAEERWSKSLTMARDLGLPVERACTLLEMGIRLENAALVDEATTSFADSGARICLAFALHAQARMALQQGNEVTSALKRYDDAIAALDEVKAEYELGVACKQRAHLYQQLGQLDNVRLDLARARSCFEAVGAAPEQAEVEREANAFSVSQPGQPYARRVGA